MVVDHILERIGIAYFAVEHIKFGQPRFGTAFVLVVFLDSYITVIITRVFEK